VSKIKEAGIIKGSKLKIDHEALGYTISTFIGIKLTKAGMAKNVQEKLRAIDEITEIHYTTGTYHLFIKVVAKNMRDLYQVLSEKVQSLDAVLSTESFVILNTSVDRERIL
jgi:Lrp/AsnC family transcriptional regulator for asnA, asnC and gidA